MNNFPIIMNNVTREEWREASKASKEKLQPGDIVSPFPDEVAVVLGEPNNCAVKISPADYWTPTSIDETVGVGYCGFVLTANPLARGLVCFLGPHDQRPVRRIKITAVNDLYATACCVDEDTDQ